MLNGEQDVKIIILLLIYYLFLNLIKFSTWFWCYLVPDIFWCWSTFKFDSDHFLFWLEKKCYAWLHCAKYCYELILIITVKSLESFPDLNIRFGIQNFDHRSKIWNFFFFISFHQNNQQSWQNMGICFENKVHTLKNPKFSKRSQSCSPKCYILKRISFSDRFSCYSILKNDLKISRWYLAFGRTFSVSDSKF